MGYGSTIESLKNAVVEQLLLADLYWASHTGDTNYSTVYSKKMYWMDVAYLDYGCYIGETGGNTVSIKLTKNGTTVSEVNVTSAGSYLYTRLSNVPASLQNYGQMQILIKTNNAPTTAFVRNLKVYGRDE